MKKYRVNNDDSLLNSTRRGFQFNFYTTSHLVITVHSTQTHSTDTQTVDTVRDDENEFATLCVIHSSKWQFSSMCKS